MDRDQLEARLKGWAQEYGGSRYENIGWQSRNLLKTLIEHEGFIPDSRGFIPVPIRSAADEVEQAVTRMEADGWYRQGRVLRCDYFLPSLPMEARLRNLHQVGVSISRTSYFDLLAQAKAFVAGALQRNVAIAA